MLTKSTEKMEVGGRHLPNQLPNPVEAIVVLWNHVDLDKGIVEVERDKRFGQLWQSNKFRGQLRRLDGDPTKRRRTSRKNSLTIPERL